MECHGFVCGNRKMAETVTLTVAHTFSSAYEAWRVLPAIKQFEKSAQIHFENEQTNEMKLIDFDSPETPKNPPVTNSDWVQSTQLSPLKLS